MGRKRSFLGFLATLFVAFFTANAFAEGYTCPTYKKYTSCNAGYYLNGTEAGNACADCTTVSNTASSTANITGGKRTTTCSGQYTSSTADDTVGTSACTGCSKYTYSCSCNTGYAISNQGSSTCSCLANTYTVSYNSNKPSGASGSISGSTADSTHTYDVAKALTSNGFSLTGWTFNGWNTKADGTGDAYTNGQSVKNLTSTNGATFTLYAQWKAKTFKVTFDSNSATSGAPSVASVTCTYDSACTAATQNSLLKTNSVFGGWNKKADGSGTNYSAGGSIKNASTSDIVLYAKWTPCTACAAGTGATCSLSVSNNTCMYTTACKDGYSSIQNNGKYNPSCTLNSYTITINKNGGSGSLTVNGKTATGTTNISFSCTHGTTFTMPAWDGSTNALTKSNSTFTGWSTSGTITCNGDKTITAKWGDCTAASKGTGVASSSLTGVTSNVCRYTHKCSTGYWNASHSKSTTASSITCEQCPEGYRNIATTDKNSCVGTFKKKGSQNPCSKPNNSKSYTCASCNPGTCDYTKNYAGTTVSDCTPTNCNQDVSSYTCLQDYYKNNSGSCSLCGDYSGTSDGNSATTCTCDQGYSADGTQNGTKTTTSAACKAIVYNISYTMNSGTNYSGAPTTYTYGVGATINGTPTRAGYTFAGWCTNSDLTENCAKTKTINATDLGNKTFYAKWTANKYTVKYSCGDGAGTPPSNGTATYNQNFTPAANTCTRSGYTFNGWNDGSTTRAAGTAFKWTYTSDKTFTATWKLNGAIDIKYNTNEGTINNYGDAVACNAASAAFALPTNVTRAGYTFAGWYNNSNLTGTAITTVSAGACTGQLEYWAKWTACNSTTNGACNCASGTYPSNGTCTNCSKSCSGVSGYTQGTYDVCKAQTTDLCYRACTKDDVPGATVVSGTITKGDVNTCVATTCGAEYFKQGTGCTKCPDNAETCGGGDDSWECDTGYEKSASGTACNAKKYTVTLNNQGATTAGTASITATYNQKLGTITAPTKTDYAFGGYCTGKDGTGTCYYNASGVGILAWNIDSNTTLYANWILDVFTCTAGKAADGTACTPGYYCPGGKVNADVKNDTTSGCMRKCPSATGQTVNSQSGASASTQCYASGAVDIYESTNTTVTGEGTKTCNWNGTDSYNASCNIVPTSCIGGYYRPADNSPFCNPVGYGYYRGAGEGVRVQNECSKLNGANSTVTTATDKSTAPTACYNVCSITATTDGNGVRNPVNAKENFNGTTIPACSYTTSCNEGYTPNGEVCAAETYKITLNHNGGTSNVNTIYLKYADGWYSESDAKITSVQKPTLSGQTFGGYLSGNTVVINNAGEIVASNTLFESNATITASWSNNPTIVCKAGTYYPGTGASCATCTTGSYCEGVSAVQDTGEAGRATCASLNGTYTAAKNASGVVLTVQISAPQGSDSKDDCYATNIEYAPNKYTSGSQTCHYDATSKSYSAACDSKVVITCAGGYALASAGAVVCTEVGKGKYSPDKDLSAYECPLNPGTNTRGTTNETTTASIEECILDNLWDTIAHGGVRKQCYWSEDSEKYDRNCPQVIVVTCDAGYWYDASQKDCVLVGDGAWSPAQSDCDGEEEQPITPGCSTKINFCPNGALTGKDNAASVLECEGVCPAGSYCVDGVEYSCATETNGEYPYSVAGSDEVADCYKECTDYKTCNSTNIKAYLKPILCETLNANSCSYVGGQLTSLVTYYGSSECVLSPTVDAAAVCPLSLVTCNMGYYYEGSLTNGYCAKCNFEDEYGKYTNSNSLAKGYKPNSTDGSKACYLIADLPCTKPICPLSNEGSCTYDADAVKQGGGYRYYGVENVLPGIATDFMCPDVVWSCKAGYDKNESANIDPTDAEDDSMPDELCTPHVYTITLNPNYADGATDEIYQKYKTGWYSNEAADKALTKVPVPVRANWTFHGYATKASALESGYKLIVDASGEFITSDAINKTYTSDTTWYAQWTQDVYYCQAGKYYEGNGSDSVLKDCVAPYYCPGVGTVAVGSTGCRETCPTPKVATPMEEPRTIASKQSDVTSCWADFAKSPTSGEELAKGDGTWKCQYTGTSDQGEYATCDIIVESCEGGYYNPAGTSACEQADSGYYSPDGDLLQTKCPQKTNYTIGTDVVRDAEADCYVVCDSYVPGVENADKVYVTAGAEYQKMFYKNGAYPACQYTVECKTGYDTVSGATPQCKAKTYAITLNKNGGSGSIAETVSCTFNGNDCTLPATSVLKRDGYNTASKWCTNADGTGVCYEAGKTVNGNVSANGTDTQLYAIWTPAVFKIELSAPDADTNAAQGPVYLKYATGWYSDVSATQPLTTLGTQLPGKGGEAYVFAGYELNGEMIIDANGSLSGSTGALTATTKDATATAQWTKGLTKCEAGTYYPGNGSSCAACMENHYCPEGRYATDSGTVGGLNPCPNGGQSAGGESATNIGVCYKTGLDYLTYIDAEQTMTRAKGTWTCNYGTVGYTDCHEDTIVVSWCAAGYYKASQNAIDCDMVGEDYWSAEADLTRDACPDGGNTDGVATSDALTDCQKRVDTYVSVSNNAKGTHVCSARLDGNGAKYDQNCQIDTVEITWCAGGYWYDAGETSVDCVQVGQNFYSAEGDTDRAACPHDGTTVIPNASTPHNICQKTKVYPGIEYDGPTVHGSGVHGCLYDQASDGKMFGEQQSDGYVSCGKITMTECESGYWWQNGNTVCEVVGNGHFGPVADANNSNNKTGRMACPNNGLTQGTTSPDATACYLEKLACDITNGSGEQTRFWDSSTVSDTAGYTVCRVDGQTIDCDTTCEITGCNTGFSLVDGACINCPENHVCVPDGGQQSCTVATNGTHPKSDAGTTDVAYCYTDCQLGQYAYAMKGRDYYSAGVVDTCEITVCMAGYTLSNGKCVECPAGMVCNPESGDDEPKSCATLTGGEYTLSAPNSDSANDCYKVCEPYEVVNGTAVPMSDKAYYPSECEFEGKSTNGNPCDIVDGVCVETSCNYNFEMDNGVCKPCAREHAISYKQGGNCVVESCANGYHPNGQQCEGDVVECSAPNAVAAKQTWDADKNAFGACMITECEEGYHLGANACQLDEQVCELEHGVGVREWNHKANNWGECIATKCEPGYTNDPSLTNELWKQCGRCNNMYSANGELAVSSYVQGCEIAACMYQGELYTLENNECRLICDTYSDETGSRRWNASRKKCERTCEPGYTSW